MTKKDIIQLEVGKVVNLVFERYGNIKPFIVEGLSLGQTCNYARIREVTVKDIDSGEFDMSKLEQCNVKEIRRKK